VVDEVDIVSAIEFQVDERRRSKEGVEVAMLARS
jgi:hypothetical protein